MNNSLPLMQDVWWVEPHPMQFRNRDAALRFPAITDSPQVAQKDISTRQDTDTDRT